MAAEYNVPTGNEERPGKKAWYLRRGTIAVVSSLAAIFFVSASLFWVIRGVRPVKFEGSSMEPTLSSGDLLLIAKPRGLERGDIIAFRFPLDPSKYFVKRIVGLPGETIRIDESGKLFINGVVTPEPYVQQQRYQISQKPSRKEAAGRRLFHNGR